MSNCLPDIKKAVAPAKSSTGHLTKARIRDFEVRYQNILGQGYAQNPLSPPPAGKKPGRRKKTKPRNLLERLDEHRSELLITNY